MLHKRIISTLLIIMMTIMFCSCKSTENSTDRPSTDITENLSSATTEEEPDVTTDEGKASWVQDYFDNYVKGFGTLTRVEINPDAGKGAGYIMLVYCSFDMKNPADTSKDTISMMAEDMAARVGTDLADVNELCIFWDVPYLNSNAKTQFERRGNGMAIGDQIFSF